MEQRKFPYGGGAQGNWPEVSGWDERYPAVHLGNSREAVVAAVAAALRLNYVSKTRIVKTLLTLQVLEEIVDPTQVV